VQLLEEAESFLELFLSLFKLLPFIEEFAESLALLDPLDAAQLLLALDVKLVLGAKQIGDGVLPRDKRVDRSAPIKLVFLRH